MAQITLSVPDAQLNRVLNGFAAAQGYTGFLEDGVTPETRIQFLRRSLVRFVKQGAVASEANEAGSTAARNARDTAEAQLDITAS